MTRIALLLVLTACGCGKAIEHGSREAPEHPSISVAATPMQRQSTIAEKPAPAKTAMLEVPADKAQLQRLLAMGYTVHDDHLHSPGVKECPFNMGGGIVQ